jgi:HEAT repeat protein
MTEARARPDQEQLRTFLAHPDPDVRRSAVDAVVELRPPWGFDALCLALLDVSDRVRGAAAEGLRSLQAQLPDEPQLFDFLEQALDSPSPSVREVAVRLLRRISDASVATFVAATTDAVPRVRVEAVQALAGFHAVPEICALEADLDADVRVEVARALTRLADPRGASTLRRLALDDEPAVRAAAGHVTREVVSNYSAWDPNSR